MSNENEEIEEEQEQEQEQQEQEQQEQEKQPQHTCGAKLEKGMKFCPACGAEVNTDAYK